MSRIPLGVLSRYSDIIAPNGGPALNSDHPNIPKSCRIGVAKVRRELGRLSPYLSDLANGVRIRSSSDHQPNVPERLEWWSYVGVGGGI